MKVDKYFCTASVPFGELSLFIAFAFTTTDSEQNFEHDKTTKFRHVRTQKMRTAVFWGF